MNEHGEFLPVLQFSLYLLVNAPIKFVEVYKRLWQKGNARFITQALIDFVCEAGSSMSTVCLVFVFVLEWITGGTSQTRIPSRPA